MSATPPAAATGAAGSSSPSARAWHPRPPRERREPALLQRPQSRRGLARNLDFSDPAAAKAAVLAHFEGWDEGLRKLIADADTITPRRVHALPVGHRWERVPGVTLLGDAAHLMSPFAGEGANLAMLDGARLALSLATHPDDTEAALSAYEEDLFPRSEESARDSADSLNTMFGVRGLEEMVAFFTSGPAGEQAPA